MRLSFERDVVDALDYNDIIIVIIIVSKPRRLCVGLLAADKPVFVCLFLSWLTVACYDCDFCVKVLVCNKIVSIDCIE